MAPTVPPRMSIAVAAPSGKRNTVQPVGPSSYSAGLQPQALTLGEHAHHRVVPVDHRHTGDAFVDERTNHLVHVVGFVNRVRAALHVLLHA